MPILQVDFSFQWDSEKLRCDTAAGTGDTNVRVEALVRVEYTSATSQLLSYVASVGKVRDGSMMQDVALLTLSDIVFTESRITAQEQISFDLICEAVTFESSREKHDSCVNTKA